LCLTTLDNQKYNLTEELEELVACGGIARNVYCHEDTKALMFLQYKSAITKLWNSKAMSARWKERGLEGLVDWTKWWFLECIQEIAKPDYCPNHVEIWHMRNKTNNQEVALSQNWRNPYQFTKLMILPLPDSDIVPPSDAVLYVACLADYDQWGENHQKNCMAESIEGFQKIAASSPRVGQHNQAPYIQ
jgi:hypothetical protein